MISIIMPVKNAEPYLTDCLNSIMLQSYSNWELIAVNDHSTDSTSAILQEFSKLDSRISCRDNSGTGIIQALRTGYDISSGQYITRMDSDDLMTEDKLKLMVSLIEEVGPKHLVTGYVEYFSETIVRDGYQKYANWLNKLSETETNFSEIYKECVVASPCWLISRRDFENCGGFTGDRFPEDYDLCFRFRNGDLQIKTVRETLHLWRDHSSRASRNDPNYLDNRFLQLKMHYFINSDFQKEKNLVLWGAGKKAKKIAMYLQDNDIQFRWICNNANKIGKNIYNIIIESDRVIKHIRDSQIIVAVANPTEQADIKVILNQYPDGQAFFFC